MRPHLTSLRTSLLAAIGVISIAGCGGTTSDGGGGSSSNACEGEEPLGDTGYAQCDDVSVNRVGAATCDNPTPNQVACAGTEEQLDCTSDADCTEGAYGRCITGGGNFEGGTFCGCVYGCTTDADCATGTVCACAGMAEGLDYSRCVPAECGSSEDCGGGECAVVSYDDGCGRSVSMACRSPLDECRSSADCAEGECGPTYDEEPHLACQTPGCAIGRPMTIDGVARAGEVVRRDDWLASAAQAVPSELPTQPGLAALRARLLGAVLS
jgi:hypothetical protein